jgi:hypothetical protein
MWVMREIGQILRNIPGSPRVGDIAILMNKNKEEPQDGPNIFPLIAYKLKIQ